jgi:hypothetical protein
MFVAKPQRMVTWMCCSGPDRRVLQRSDASDRDYESD